MFRPKSKEVKPPKKVAVFDAPQARDTFSDYLEGIKCTNDPTKAYLGGALLLLTIASLPVDEVAAAFAALPAPVNPAVNRPAAVNEVNEAAPVPLPDGPPVLAARQAVVAAQALLDETVASHPQDRQRIQRVTARLQQAIGERDNLIAAQDAERAQAAAAAAAAAQVPAGDGAGGGDGGDDDDDDGGAAEGGAGAGGAVADDDAEDFTEILGLRFETDVVANCRGLFKNKAAKAILLLGLARPQRGTAPNENQVICALARGNIIAAIDWIANLVNAAKKRRLETPVVTSYLAVNNAPDVAPTAVVSFMNLISSHFPDMISLDVFRQNLLDNKWTTYRCTRVTTAEVVCSIMNELVSLGVLKESDEIAKKFKEAKAKAWDARSCDDLDQRVVAIASIFMEVSGRPLDGWYQGKNAVEATPSKKVLWIRAYISKWLTLTNNLDKINAAEDLEELRKAAAENNWFN